MEFGNNTQPVETKKPSVISKIKSFGRDFWAKPKLFYSFLAVFSILAVSVVLQFLMFDGRAGWNSKIGPIDISGKESVEISKALNDYTQASKVTVKSQTKTYAVDYDSIGLHADVEQLTNDVTKYPIWQRAIPFSFIVRLLPHEYPLRSVADPEKLLHFAGTVVAEDKLEAKNAGVTLISNKATLDPAADGYSYDAAKITEVLKNQQIVPGAEITLVAQVDKPARSDDQVKPLLDNAQKMIDNPPTITAQSEQFKPDAATVTAWLTVVENDKKELEISINEAKLNEYIAMINKKLFVPSQPTSVTMVDGVETGKTEGTPGQGIDSVAIYKSISEAFKAGNGATVEAKLAAQAPKIVYNRTYSKSQKGVQALLDYLTSSQTNYGISLKQLDGGTMVANSRGDVRFLSASTYKMFISYYLMKQIESGAMKWEDTTTVGKSVSDCFEVMIVRSDNACAEAFGNKFGWSNVQNSLKAIGLNNSGFGTDGAYSTANDETLFLTKLMEGTLMSDDNKGRMIDAMTRQIYRAGIPSGAKNAKVADKVGFLYDYLNDAAIVYAPGGTYVLTILTQKSSWAQIADATAQINALLN